MFNIRTKVILVILVVVVAGSLTYTFWFHDDWKGVEYAVWSKPGQTKSDIVYLMPHPDSVKYADCWLDELHENATSDKHDSLESIAFECQGVARPDLKELLEYGDDDYKTRPPVRDKTECLTMYSGLLHSRDEHKRRILESVAPYQSMAISEHFSESACPNFPR